MLKTIRRIKMECVCSPVINAISAIFFDLDNTLIETRKGDALACDKWRVEQRPGAGPPSSSPSPVSDSAPQLVDIMKERYSVCAEDARRAADRFLKSFRSCPDNGEAGLDEWRLTLWAEALGSKYANIAAEVYVQWVELRYSCLSLSPSVSALLSTLRHHYLLALVTNGPSSAQWEKVRRLDLCDFFDVVLVSGDLPWEKPHRNIFLEACNCLGVEPRNCLMVGDKLETDIQGGVNARLGGTVWVLPSYEVPDTRGADLLADFTLDAVTDLFDILPPQPECPSISHVRVCSVPSPRIDPGAPHVDETHSVVVDGS